MIKIYSIFIAVLIFATNACSSTTLLPMPTIAPVTETAPAPEPVPSPTDHATIRATVRVEQTISFPSGLQVVYLQDGNIWSWTVAGGNVLLIGTGDVSTVRLSENGEILAFMRGPEVWTARMDGTDAHVLVKQKAAGGSLSFAPNGSLLAISTIDHIDVIEVLNATSTAAITYPAITNGYYPEVVWSIDAMGFKTIVPSGSDSGQVQFLFVFPNGKVANLAMFEMLPPSDSLPFISPDGGYVIFAAHLGDGRESLYLMDSSGAAKVFGEPAERVRALGWLTDSKHFVYEWQNQEQELILMSGLQEEFSKELVFNSYEAIRWLDEKRFLAWRDENLYLSDINGGEMLIAERVIGFDFID